MVQKSLFNIINILFMWGYEVGTGMIVTIITVVIVLEGAWDWSFKSHWWLAKLLMYINRRWRWDFEYCHGSDRVGKSVWSGVAKIDTNIYIYWRGGSEEVGLNAIFSMFINHNKIIKPFDIDYHTGSQLFQVNYIVH